MKPADLKVKLLEALEGSSSQQPVDVKSLYALGTEEEVQAALLELYHQQQIHCCVITRKGVERIVWWRLMEVQVERSISEQHVDQRGRHSRKPSGLRQVAHEKVVECPGIAAAALIQHMLHEFPRATKTQALMTLSNMRHQKRIHAEGPRGHYIYHPRKGG